MRTQALPPYRAMLAVDMKDFSSNKGMQHEPITERIPQILAAAFTRAGLGDEWADGQRFPRSEGDGYVVGFRPPVLPFLVNPLLHALQAELEELNRTDPTPRQTPIRMRVAINVGPVTDSGENPIGDGSGTARVETHRLLDARAVKDLLDRSGPETYVVAIISARVFEDAVSTGYSGDSEDAYAQIDVQEKSYRGVAYLRVPYVTGELVKSGLLPRPRNGRTAHEGTADRTLATSSAETVFRDNYGQLHSGSGDQHINVSPAHGRRRGRH